MNVVARVDRQGAAPLRARYGTEGVGSQAPVPWDPEFRAASTSKTFTAVVVLQLAAERRLSLDDTVEHWLPGVVRGHGNDGARITVRDLLQQTSGLYDYITDPGVQDRLLNHFEENRDDATPPGELVALAVSRPPLFTPGPAGTPRRWAYSNTNYLLAAMIAEKASGVGWRELVEHRVIAPLGLRHTYIPGENPFLVGPHERVTIDGPGGVPVDLTEESFQHTADSGWSARRPTSTRSSGHWPRGGCCPPGSGGRCGGRCRTTICRCRRPAYRAVTVSGCGSCR